MKTEHLLIIVAAAAVAYFGGFIPNTAPYAKKNAATGSGQNAPSNVPTANPGSGNSGYSYWGSEAGRLLADLLDGDNKPTA